MFILFWPLKALIFNTLSLNNACLRLFLLFKVGLSVGFRIFAGKKRMEELSDANNPKGYYEWSTVKKVGRPRIMKSPAHMWDLANQYFKWAEANPIEVQDFIRSGPSAGMVLTVKRQRPLSWMGFEAWLTLNHITSDLSAYRFTNRYPEFSIVVREIASVMKAQKFDGAAAGIFKENLIAREMGLHDTTKVVQAEEFDYSKLSDSALEEIAKLKDEAKP